MRILFIGTVKFSLKLLERLILLDANIVGVCTKKSSDFNSDFSDLTPICKESNIPYIYVNDINSTKNIKWIKELSPDVIFCLGWSNLIKEELLNIPPLGIVGYHPAKLPQNRGRHPLIWALVLGLEKSASTFFFMDDKADSGDIILQEEFEILDTDDASKLYNKVLGIALKQVELLVFQLRTKSYTRFEQNHKLSNNWRKRNYLDGNIDFRMSSKAIYNLVRGLSKPYIGASIKYNNQDIRIWKVQVVDINLKNIEYGKVLSILNDTITVKTYDGAIKLLEHEFKTLPTVGEYL